MQCDFSFGIILNTIVMFCKGGVLGIWQAQDTISRCFSAMSLVI
eukprot:COSAG01_NODE_2013_length_8643_cov_30.224081_5_plen_44_part_00